MFKAALCVTLLASAMAAGPALAQGSGQQGKGASTSTTGALPQDSLAQERKGAIGTSPAPVQQGGAASEDQAQAEAMPTGKLPAGSLPAERRGAIGEKPEPVVQGGGKTE